MRQPHKPQDPQDIAMTLLNQNLSTPQAAVDYLKAKYQGRTDIEWIGGLLPVPKDHGFDDETIKSLKLGSKHNQGVDFFEREKLCIDCEQIKPWTAWKPSLQGKSTGGAPEGRRCAKCDSARAVRAKRERKNGRALKCVSRRVDVANKLKQCRGCLCQGTMQPWSSYPAHATRIAKDGSPRESYCKACRNHAQNTDKAKRRKQAAKLSDAALQSRKALCPDCGLEKSWDQWLAAHRTGPNGSPAGACRDCFNEANRPRAVAYSRERRKQPHHRVNNQLRNFVRQLANTTGTAKDRTSGLYFEWTGFTEEQLMEHLGPMPDDGREWAVDHIWSLASYDFEHLKLNDEDEYLKAMKHAWQPLNLRWMEARANERKNDACDYRKYQTFAYKPRKLDQLKTFKRMPSTIKVKRAATSLACK